MGLIVAAVILTAVASLAISTLTYALRDLSRGKLATAFERRHAERWLVPTLDRGEELKFVTAALRQAINIVLWLLLFIAFDRADRGIGFRFGWPVLIAIPLTMTVSVALPTALAKVASAELIAISAPVLHAIRWLLAPLAWPMNRFNASVGRVFGIGPAAVSAVVEEEIIAAVEEGQKTGVVDEQGREMIESVIELREVAVERVMTPLPDVAAVPVSATLTEVQEIVDRSGHSRLPVFEGTIDHVIGMLYARDLLRYYAQPPDKLDIRPIMRPALFVRETQSARDLLREFRDKKSHIAIVLDEYGSMTGLVTVLDIVEELFGQIEDESDPPPQCKKIDDRHFDVDARIGIDELNLQTGLHLPEDAGYETLGGFVSTTIGRLPGKGSVLEHEGVRYTVLDAEPQRVKRVAIELPRREVTA
jgi:CBS domain containing-hemolysin-like protein